MEFLGEVAKSCKDASLEKLGFFVDQGELKSSWNGGSFIAY